MAQAICSRCYQIFDGKEFEEHRKKKCFALMLKPMDITLRTTVPVNVLTHLLEKMGIVVSYASHDYPTIVYEEEDEIKTEPVSPMSKDGFSNFRDKYKNELYSKDHNVSGDKHIKEYEKSLQIEEVNDTVEPFKKNKK